MNSNVAALEMEAIHPRPSREQSTFMARSNNKPRLLQQLGMLIRLYMEYYPILSTIVLFSLVGFLLYGLTSMLKHPLSQNVMHHDYSAIDSHYDFKSAQMDHWCLWGRDDEACPCDDFADPSGRPDEDGWTEAHKTNIASIDQSLEYDLVFLGDEMVSRMNGVKLDNKDGEAKKIGTLWNKTFVSEEREGEFRGLALGIPGDSAPNLAWRFEHGEMPKNVNVWWLWIGTNDLARGGCSEEATVLGILRVAEEIVLHNADATVVIMGILPRTKDSSGSLFSSGKIYNMEQARKKGLLWPAIKDVNRQLKNFCEKKENTNFVYFDVDQVFVTNVKDKKVAPRVAAELMPDYVHPSYKGYQKLIKAVEDEMTRIMIDEDVSTDIEVEIDEDAE